MDEMKSKIAALAKLDKTPDEIMAEERLEFEREIAKCEKWNRSWWRRYASWRLKSLEKDEFNPLTLLCSLTVSGLITAFCVLAIVLGSTGLLFSAVLLAVLAIGAHASYAQEYEDVGVLGRHLRRFFFFPFMPFLRIMDFVILYAERRIPGRYDRHLIVEMQAPTESSAEVVEHYYLRGIEEARAELLGEASELRVTEKDLFQRRERIQRQIQQLAARMGHAKDDPPRKALLKQAYDALTGRRSRIQSAQGRVEETIAKTSAILDECKATVSNLRGPIGDAILLAEIERGSEGDDIAITNAHQAVDAHVEHVRSKLIQLATAVTSPTFTLPSAEREEELEAYFARVERVAEEVSAIGITPVEKSVI